MNYFRQRLIAKYNILLMFRYEIIGTQNVKSCPRYQFVIVKYAECSLEVTDILFKVWLVGVSEQGFRDALIRRISTSSRNQRPDKTVRPHENVPPKAFSFVEPQLTFIATLLPRKRCELTITTCSGLVKERERRVEYLSRNLAFLDDDGGNPGKRGMSRNDILSPFGGSSKMVTPYRQSLNSPKKILSSYRDDFNILIDSMSMSVLVKLMDDSRFYNGLMRF